MDPLDLSVCWLLTRCRGREVVGVSSGSPPLPGAPPNTSAVNNAWVATIGFPCLRRVGDDGDVAIGGMAIGGVPDTEGRGCKGRFRPKVQTGALFTQPFPVLPAAPKTGSERGWGMGDGG